MTRPPGSARDWFATRADAAVLARCLIMTGPGGAAGRRRRGGGDEARRVHLLVKALEGRGRRRGSFVGYAPAS